jgi:hypothetical protein
MNPSKNQEIKRRRGGVDCLLAAVIAPRPDTSQNKNLRLGRPIRRDEEGDVMHLRVAQRRASAAPP